MIHDDLISTLSGGRQLCQVWDEYDKEIEFRIDEKGNQVFDGPFQQGKTLFVNVRQVKKPAIRRTQFATYYQ